MDGKFPQTILTELNMGIKDAIFTESPNTKHAFPMGHITSKLPSWFSNLLGPQFERFKLEFDKLYELETIEEFEHLWIEIVKEFALGFDRHATLLYSLRSYWALPYLQGWFFGGLLTNGHLLLFKSFLKGFLDSQTRLKDFVEQVMYLQAFSSLMKYPSVHPQPSPIDSPFSHPTTQPTPTK